MIEEHQKAIAAELSPDAEHTISKLRMFLCDALDFLRER